MTCVLLEPPPFLIVLNGGIIHGTQLVGEEEKRKRKAKLTLSRTSVFVRQRAINISSCASFINGSISEIDATRQLPAAAMAKAAELLPQPGGPTRTRPFMKPLVSFWKYAIRSWSRHEQQGLLNLTFSPEEAASFVPAFAVHKIGDDRLKMSPNAFMQDHFVKRSRRDPADVQETSKPATISVNQD